MEKKIVEYWRRSKPYAIAGLIFLWFGLVLHGFTSNPSAGESHAKAKIIKEEMKALLVLGGKVIEVKENSKFGGSVSIVTLHDEGWSNALVTRYENELQFRGWRKLDKPAHSYCMSDIMVKIIPNAGTIDAHGINMIIMKFNGETKKKCR